MKNWMKTNRALWLLGAIAVLWCGPASAAGAPPGLDTLRAYQGTWQMHVVHYKTKYSKAGAESSTVRNDCWRSGDFYACDQFVKGVSGALLVFTYDAAHGVYHSNVVTPAGAPAGSGTLLISGNRWTFPWQDKDAGKTVYIRIINTFTNPDTIEYRREYSYDKIHWVVTATGTEHRTHS
jgi:hypothetical protein